MTLIYQFALVKYYFFRILVQLFHSTLPVIAKVDSYLNDFLLLRPHIRFLSVILKQKHLIFNTYETKLC